MSAQIERQKMTYVKQVKHVIQIVRGKGNHVNHDR